MIEIDGVKFADRGERIRAYFDGIAEDI